MGGYAFGLARRAPLARVTGDSLHGDGPFIISSYRPLEGPNSLTTPYIFEDLSSVPPDVVEFWVQQFKCPTSQERSRDKETVSSVALRLRTAIAIFAIGCRGSRRLWPSGLSSS